ncbi:MAG: tRNA uridine-5-carboxymethylaminomethyl(34) synthesis enzyme MnmG [Deltaproteobacteria bacterium]|nr:tRNA uridine-5-carboxymethylaminomethyl(34) synthesis enzyme MnmG [Deltaproteobacteria bacterium]
MIIVIGGGHAGIEAAAASARLGVRTVMVTLSKNKIGEMSCNPAIGGVGKGQLVKEIDILGGLMAEAIDKTGIQFRTLNSSRGSSVKSTRAQADRVLYQKWMQNRIEAYPNLVVLEDEVEDILVKNEKVVGVILKRSGQIGAQAVVVTTGTFLRGLMHQGELKKAGGRFGEQAAKSLSSSLKRLGFELIRLKTGTPPRLDKNSIDFSKCVPLEPDLSTPPFSFWSDRILQPQIRCWITKTNRQTHELIQANKSRSPLFNGQIQSIGPRYCPSIEDKVFRFPEKESHQIFLEPEGLDSELVYPNGISTSLPIDVQDSFIRLIPGLEDVKVIRYGYAVEYDAIRPTQLKHTLESKTISGLFFAGQINGTSGYEEAAGQGIVAGINAALYWKQEPPFDLKRHEAYIGVMIDDLVTLGVEEPYRMFTSRVEFRLSIREDNAYVRLGPKALELGLVNDDKKRKLSEALEGYNDLKNRAKSISISTEQGSFSLEVLARRTDIDVDAKSIATKLGVDPKILETVIVDFKLAGYLSRHQNEIKAHERLEKIKIPKNFRYGNIPGLRAEFREKLEKIKPETLGQVSRIPGITPACLALLEIFISKGFRDEKVLSCS